MRMVALILIATLSFWPLPWWGAQAQEPGAREQSLISFFPSPGKDTLNFAVGSMISAEESLVYYGELAKFLAKALGKKARLIQRKTYGDVNDLILRGQVDLAFVCTGPYLELEGRGIRALLVPIVRGRDHYRSYIIVRKDSGIKDIMGLWRKRFGLVDELSLTGKLYPERLLLSMGEKLERFFSYYFFTHSHDRSIEAVTMGLADGAAVDSLVWEQLAASRPSLTRALKVIHRSSPFGIPPLVMSPGAEPSFRERVVAALTGMHLDPEGKKVLSHLHIDRFEKPRPDLYESAKAFFQAPNSMAFRGEGR